MIKLLPCPFCGGVADADADTVSEGEHDWQTCWVECTACKVRIEDDRCVCHHADKRGKMLARWNTRAPHVIRIPFSFFSEAEREMIQAANPGVPIEDVA